MFNIAIFKFLHVYKVRKVNTDMQIGVKKIEAKNSHLKNDSFSWKNNRYICFKNFSSSIVKKKNCTDVDFP